KSTGDVDPLLSDIVHGPAREDDLGLDDFEMDDFNLEDIDASAVESGDTGLQDAMGGGKEPLEDLNATVILHNMTEDLKSVIGDMDELDVEQTSTSELVDFDLAGDLAQELGLDDSAMNQVDPMGEDFSATQELGQMNDEIGTLGQDSVISSSAFGNDVIDPMAVDYDATQELDNLMGELDGLLDEDAPKP
ncbi:MAG: hypothetical protein Q9M19_03540, partial [Mariprofundaceae bacterium]|nr:hypothetical protein [Mariprofundaceae bacterium]